MSVIKVLLADDHGLFGEGLRLILDAQPDIEIVAETTNADDTIEACRRSDPDVVLVGLTSAIDTAVVTAAVVEGCGQHRVLALALDGEGTQLCAMLRAGASGCGLKGWSGDDLVAAVRAVYRGAVYLDPKALHSLLEDAENTPAVDFKSGVCASGRPGERVLGRQFAQREAGLKAGESTPAGSRSQRLNRNERDTVALLAEGRTTEETAERLGMSVAAVQTHRSHAMDKLEARNRAQLVRYAMRRGFRFE